MFEGLIKQSLTKNLDYLMNRIGKEVYHIVFNRILEYQISEYKRNINTKTFLHRSKPVSLLDIYHPLYLKHDIFRIRTESLNGIFRFSNYISIIGFAGSGKSMLLKYLFIKCINDSFKIPIKIELRYLNDYKSGLIDYIYNEIFKFHELAVDDKIINRLLNSGKFIFFLDGFDELKHQKLSNINKEVDEFTKKYEKNFYVLTSRPHVDIELHNSFKNYTLDQLTVKESIEFVSMQQLEKEIEVKIVESINKIRNKDILSFLSNPLLLSMYLLTFQTYARIPDKKCIFYRQVFDTLYDTHDSLSKLAFEREKRSELSKDKIEKILQGFSFISYFGNKLNFDLDYYNQSMNLIKSKIKIDFENDKLLYDLLVSIAIFVNEGYEYSYAHRSLQEYFAALSISNLTIENKTKFYDNLIDKIFDKRLNISEFYNLFSLLLEVDRINLLKLFCLPVLEKFQERSEDVYNKNMDIVRSFLPNKRIMIPIFELILNKEVKDVNFRLNNNNSLKSILIVLNGSTVSSKKLFENYIKQFKNAILENYEYERFIFNLM